MEKGIQILLVVTVLPEPTWSGSGGQPAELLIPEDAHLAAGCYTTHLATDVLSLLISLRQYFILCICLGSIDIIHTLLSTNNFPIQIKTSTG